MERKYLIYLAFGILAVLLLITFGYESGSAFPACRYWGGMMGGMMRPVPLGYNFAFWIFLILVVIFVYYLLKEQ